MNSLILRIVICLGVVLASFNARADGLNGIGGGEGINSGQAIGGANGISNPTAQLAPSWVLCSTGNPGPCPIAQAATVDCYFSSGLYWYNGAVQTSCPLSISRASNETNLLPSSVSGYPYTTFGNNALAITASFGLQVFQASTNVFLNSTAPVTQTITLPATGSWTTWVNGAGSITTSAGTATCTGYGTATNGTPNTISCTGAGSVVFTVSGALNAAQAENLAFGTPFIATGATSVARAADNITATGTFLTALQGSAVSVVVSAGPRSGPNLGYAVLGGTDLQFGDNGSTTVFSAISGHNLNGTLGSGTYTSGIVKQAISTNSSGRSIVGNNGTVATDGFALAFNGYIGYTGSFGYWDRNIQRLTVFNSRLPDATLKALTQ